MSTTIVGPPGDSTPTTAFERMTGHAWAVLLVLCGTVFLEGLDVAMMGVALPSMRADLDLSTSALQWVVSAYVLGYGGFVLLGGRAADLFGRRRMFLLWLAVFIGFSGLGGLATDGWMLIVARFMTGVAAGFLTPASLSIITTSFAPGELRNRALLVYGGIGAGGFTLGMVAGGLLTTAGWRWVFFAPVLFASLLMVFALRFLTEGGAMPMRGPRGFDAAGALTMTGGMLFLVLGVVRAPDVAGVLTAATLAASALLLAAFVAVERRAAAPLVRLGILRSAPLVRANLGALLFVGSFVAFQFILVLYLQELRGWSALETGLALLLAGIDAILAPTVTPWFVRRFGNVRVILAGMLLGVAAYTTFLRIGDDWPYPMLMPGLVLMGLAFAATYGPLTIAATDDVAEEEQGLAGGLLNASVQFGAALMLALVTAVNVVVTGDDPTRTDMLDGYRAALLVPLVAVAIGAVLTATGLRRPALGDAVAGTADGTTLEPTVPPTGVEAA
ncbi:MAG: MFS transporter [Acidimicrobiales bacterium]|nr:MFS transporter [Acidimicrobiales bacterium]